MYVFFVFLLATPQLLDFLQGFSVLVLVELFPFLGPLVKFLEFSLFVDELARVLGELGASHVYVPTNDANLRLKQLNSVKTVQI